MLLMARPRPQAHSLGLSFLFDPPQRRLVSLALLIGAPHMVAALARLFTKGLRSDQDDDDDDDDEQADPSPRQRTRRRVLLNLLNSVWVRALPEIWFAWFLIKGRNVEWTKSLMGMSYAS